MTNEEKEKALKALKEWEDTETARVFKKSSEARQLLALIPEDMPAHLSGADIFTEANDELTFKGIAQEAKAEFKLIPSPPKDSFCIVRMPSGVTLYSGNIPLKGTWHKTSKVIDSWEPCLNHEPEQLTLPGIGGRNV